MHYTTGEYTREHYITLQDSTLACISLLHITSDVMSLHACKYTYRRLYIQTFRYITHLLRYTLTYMHANRQADTFRQTPTGENMYACVNLKNTFMFCTKKHTDDEYIHPSKTISAHA